jgi:hypothetical protein
LNAANLSFKVGSNRFTADQATEYFSGSNFFNLKSTDMTKQLSLSQRIIFQTCFLLFVLNSLTSAVFGQKKAIDRIYVEGSAGWASQNGSMAELGVKTILKSNWIFSVGYMDIIMDARNTPADYEPGYFIFLFLPIKEAEPNVGLQSVNFTAGRRFVTGKNTWFSAEGGLSLVKGDKMTFKREQNPGTNYFFFVGNISSNYTTTSETINTVGGIMKADFNWAFSSFAGLGAGVYTNINSIQTPVGFKISLLVGYMNRKRK